MTPAEIIYHRRVQVLDHAGRTSVSEACRTFGVSRTSYYRWAGRAQRYGLAALLPKGRRPPVMPTATPPDQVEAVLAEAVARPTIGAQRLVDHLADRGVRLSSSGVQKILRRHRLGRRAQRVAALAQLTATTTGILTSDARTARSGSATSQPAPVTWSPWTPSMSASAKASGRAARGRVLPDTLNGDEQVHDRGAIRGVVRGAHNQAPPDGPVTGFVSPSGPSAQLACR